MSLGRDSNQKLRSIEELYIAYAAPIGDYLYRMLGNRELARDLTQEVFYRATRALFFKPDIEYVSAWLYKIARNLFLDHQKKHGRVCEESLEKIKAEGREFSENLTYNLNRENEINEIWDTVQQVLESLPEIQRSVILLRDYEGLSYAEISSVLEITISSVKSHLFRARVNFRETYDELDKWGDKK